ncbi:MAG: NfeD family protein [Acidobacteria bacterium]|nr:NfeD family protein [Acidobacteriota bacterium]
MEYLWVVWALLAVAFIVAEIFTTGFVLLWFGIGAILAALLALAGVGGLGLQTLVFLFTSIVLTAASRTIFLKYLVTDTDRSSLRVGTGSLPGQRGVVVTPSQGALREGEIKVYGSIWKAIPEEDIDLLQEGEEVEIARVDGNSLYVRKPRREPSWRELEK